VPQRVEVAPVALFVAMVGSFVMEDVMPWNRPNPSTAPCLLPEVVESWVEGVGTIRTHLAVFPSE